MSWEKVKEITDEDLSAGKIANLPNHPNRGAGFGETGLTASQLKAYFDKNVTLLRDTINNIIQEGDPATLAGKIYIGGNGDFVHLSDLVASIEDEGGGFSDIIWVNVDGEADVLNGFLQSLKKNKVQSKQGGTDKGKVYIIDENSDDALLGYSEDATPNSIVKRTEEGDILVPEGSTNDDAAISRKDAAALLSEAVTKDVFQEEQNRTNTFVKSAKVEYDEANHVIRLTFTDGNGETDTSSVDLPLEMAFVGARLEEGNLVFTLQNGQEVSVPIGDVLGGIVTSGALAQSLSGNEEDKAPSVKAVNGGLDGKVDIRTDRGKWVYTTEEGVQTIRKIGTAPVSWNIPWFDENKNLKSSTPVADNDAVPKGWAEEKLAGKLDTKTRDGMWVYTTEYGTQDVRRLVTSPSEWNVPLYATNGVLYTNDPTLATSSEKEKACANVGYVDNKVDPIKEDVELLKDLSPGVLYDIVTVESMVNPVTVPSNALPAATIDKIGTGIKTEVINEALTNTNPSEVMGALSATCIAEGVYRLNGTFEYEPLRATFTLLTPIDTSEGETIYVSAELLSGSIVDRNGNPSSVTIGIQSLREYWSVGEQRTIVGEGSPISEFTITFNYESVSFIDAIIAIHIGKHKQTYGVPVASVKKGTETVYTVPKQIRTLKAHAIEGYTPVDVYGLALSDTVYNYLDLVNKQYVIKCAMGKDEHNGHAVVPYEKIIDVSAYLTDEDGEITVSAGDRISFCDNDGILVPYDVPNAITYYTKKGV